MHICRYAGVYIRVYLVAILDYLAYSCMCIIMCILLLSVIVSSWNTNSIQTCLASIIYTSLPCVVLWLQNGWTALYLAAANGHTATLEVLVAAGAGKDIQTKVKGIMTMSC